MIDPEPDVGTRVRVTLYLPSMYESTDGMTGTVAEHPAASYLLVPVLLDGPDALAFYHPRNLTEEPA